MLQQRTSNTFGDEIEDEEDKKKKAKPAELTAGVRINAKEPKSKKVKFSSIAKYIITELTILDEEWQDVSWYAALDDEEADGDFENYEYRLSEILGATQALFQLGRNFGVSASLMQQCIPNINADEKEAQREIGATIRDV